MLRNDAALVVDDAAPVVDDAAPVVDDAALVMVGASVQGLLGEYDHSIEIPEDELFSIIHGENGVGKTKFLEIIDGLTRLDVLALGRLPFKSAKLVYSDGSRLSVEKECLKREDDTGGEVSGVDVVQFLLERPGREKCVWVADLSIRREIIERNSGGRYVRISEDLFRDRMNGRLLDSEALFMRHQRGGISRSSHEGPQEDLQKLKDFTQTVPCFLIETQRLRFDEQYEQELVQGFHDAETDMNESRILKQAEKIQEQLLAAQRNHSTVTQQLDRTFPDRVLRNHQKDGLNQEDIRDRYIQQSDFRRRLGRLTSISLEDNLPLPEGDLDDWALNLLNQYLDDAEKKFEPFESLVEKIELFEDIVNRRFRNKRLRVNSADGLVAEHSKTGRVIPLDSLSSGEQHEVVLLIDLLFNVPRGAIVLIDEPEISLHVLWQLAFIPDVEEIAKIVDFRFIVATHSPQIVNNRWDRTVALGSE